MKPKLTKHKYKDYDDFLAIRRELSGEGQRDVFRLGASDIATIYTNGSQFGMNEYTSPTVFFYQCCDYVDKPFDYSLVPLRGQIQERIIHDQYWRYMDPQDPTPEAFLANWYGPKIVYRTARKANYILENPNFPNVFITPDYIIPKNEFTKGGPLELKSPSSRAVDKYEEGVPTMYVIQSYTQQLMLGQPYGELFMVIDATWPKLLPFEANEKIYANIIASTNDFCEKVLAGKKIVYSRKSKKYKEQALGELAPNDNGDPLYTEYLKERHKPGNTKLTLPGEDDQLEKVIAYLKLKKRINDVHKKKLLKAENEIREWFTPGVGAIEFDGLGKISWIEKFTVSDKILKNYKLLQS